MIALGHHRNNNKKKLKLVGKTSLKLILIAGGVTVAIVFPSTTVLAPRSAGWLRYWMVVRERLKRLGKLGTVGRKGKPGRVS